ncbi:MAG: hypothetical protein AAGB22_12090 [Bacteroidota bacterium]
MEPEQARQLLQTAPEADPETLWEDYQQRAFELKDQLLRQTVVVALAASRLRRLSGLGKALAALWPAGMPYPMAANVPEGWSETSLVAALNGTTPWHDPAAAWPTLNLPATATLVEALRSYEQALMHRKQQLSAQWMAEGIAFHYWHMVQVQAAYESLWHGWMLDWTLPVPPPEVKVAEQVDSGQMIRVLQQAGLEDQAVLPARPLAAEWRERLLPGHPEAVALIDREVARVRKVHTLLATKK